LLINLCIALGFSSAQSKKSRICINHFYLVLDSLTYKEFIQSSFISDTLAFSYEKEVNSWKGFYLIGSDNIIELFNTKSHKNRAFEVGDMWLCLSSLKAGVLDSLSKTVFKDYPIYKAFGYKCIDINTNNEYQPITLWEMSKRKYKKKTKRKYYDSMNFSSTDYNDSAESDSSKSFLFQNISGIDLKISSADSISFCTFLNNCGYTLNDHFNNKVIYNNGNEFINLIIYETCFKPTITGIYLKLNKKVETKNVIIGNSEIQLKGYDAIWLFDK